eukprot:3223146-Pleurochrysis_carterae.AAC.2
MLASRVARHDVCRAGVRVPIKPVAKRLFVAQKRHFKQYLGNTLSLVISVGLAPRRTARGPSAGRAGAAQLQARGIHVGRLYTHVAS